MLVSKATVFKTWKRFDFIKPFEMMLAVPARTLSFRGNKDQMEVMQWLQTKLLFIFRADLPIIVRGHRDIFKCHCYFGPISLHNMCALSSVINARVLAYPNHLHVLMSLSRFSRVQFSMSRLKSRGNRSWDLYYPLDTYLLLYWWCGFTSHTPRFHGARTVPNC